MTKAEWRGVAAAPLLLNSKKENCAAGRAKRGKSGIVSRVMNKTSRILSGVIEERRETMNLTKKQFEAAAILVLLIILILAGLLSSCNVTRTVTTKAEYYQRGDTTIQIVTRTTESYDGKVDATKFLQAGTAAGL